MCFLCLIWKFDNLPFQLCCTEIVVIMRYFVFLAVRSELCHPKQLAESDSDLYLSDGTMMADSETDREEMSM